MELQFKAGKRLVNQGFSTFYLLMYGSISLKLKKLIPGRVKRAISDYFDKGYELKR